MTRPKKKEQLVRKDITCICGKTKTMYRREAKFCSDKCRLVYHLLKDNEAFTKVTTGSGTADYETLRKPLEPIVKELDGSS